MTTPEPLWSAERIEDEMLKYVHDPAYIDGATIVATAMRDEYEADRAAHLARIAELEAQLISVSSELTSTSNADRYYRGFNDGFAHAEARITELEAMVSAPKGGERQAETGVRGGLLKGRIRMKGVLEPNTLRPTFDEALQMATTDDLMWALELLITHPNAKRTWCDHRIKHIDKRLREIAAEAQP
jgi:hypothetical protein